MAVEAFFPVEWFGKKRLEAGSNLRMNIVLVSYYQEMTMAWSGDVSLQHAEDPHMLRTVVLETPDMEKRAENKSAK